MKRFLFAVAALVTVFVAFIAWRESQKPELPKGITAQLDGSYGVAGFAVVDSAGVVQAPDGMYYDFALSLDPEDKAFIRSERLYVAGFEPFVTTNWEDSLGRFPVLAGTWIYYRE